MNDPSLVKLPGSKGRLVGESLGYAVGHQYRCELLAALHEGPACASQLARMIHQPLSNVGHHIEALLARGSIEVAFQEPVRATMQNFYRVTKLPSYSTEEFRELEPDERQTTLALAVQGSTAETMAALWAGTLCFDPLVMLAWNWITLDEVGRIDLAIEQERCWDRIHEIEAEAANRRAKSKEPGIAYVVALYGYKRARNSAPEPLRTDLFRPPETSFKK